MNKTVKYVAIYFVVIFSGLLTSFLVVNLAWEQFGSKATKVILSLGENGSLGRLDQDLQYQLMLLKALENDDKNALYNAHCYKMENLVKDINPSLAEDIAQKNRLLDLSTKASEKIKELKSSGKCE
jgi:hypothetical protein